MAAASVWLLLAVVSIGVIELTIGMMYMVYYRVECHYNVMLSHCARLVIAFNLNFQACSQKVALYLRMLQLKLCNNLDNKIISKC